MVATEESGDRLGAGLMKVLRQRLGGAVRFEGVGGRGMARQGLVSLFPIEELSIIGFSAVVRRLPTILQHIRETADAVLETAPDILVIIDSPDFTHRVARRVRAKDAAIPIIDYVSPSVWAWRPGRARAMRGYVDHVLALLPFEPEAHSKLGGPPCSYVGHPLIEQIDTLRPGPEERDLGLLQALGVAFEPVLPTMPHLQDPIAAALKHWPMQPRVVVGEADKRAAFRLAHAAFAKSGTVTLELAISGVPMVAAYKAGAVEAWIVRRRISSSSVILANLVVGENVVPEFIQEDCTPANLAPALRDVLGDTPLRARQVDAFARIDAIMSTGQKSPSVCAADIILAELRRRSG